MKKTLCLITALFCYSTAFCQTIDTTKRVTKLYHVNYPVVSVLIAAGASTDILAISRIKGKSDISDAEMNALNPGLLNAIDHWALEQKPGDRNQFKTISDYGQTPVFLLPTLLLFNKNVRKEWLGLLFMYVEGHTITFTFYNYSFLGPTFQNRYRPMTYYNEFPMAERESGNNRNSFYSGHVASCAYSTFFMAKVFCDYHPYFGTGKKILIYSAATLPPLAMAWCRVKALDHFPSDCAVGLALGAVIGVAIPEFHKVHLKNISLGMFSSPQGNGLSFHWALPGTKKIASVPSLSVNN